MHVSARKSPSNAHQSQALTPPQHPQGTDEAASQDQASP
eukprot:CAMPEP_0174946654 /NCGR_PEP_ID=MMETSP1355-20121228/84683_1 /TAXON_ID=464990 /ORGANISM="Hemiselmis tepida, Strain CCMP443" /LENGTH=38 /DNA_ID= /DNA_START= /DNA_END= /DNA_ORIENTATION=